MNPLRMSNGISKFKQDSFEPVVGNIFLVSNKEDDILGDPISPPNKSPINMRIPRPR